MVHSAHIIFGSHQISITRIKDSSDWSHRLGWSRTAPSQGADTGSNPVGITNNSLNVNNPLLFFFTGLPPDLFSSLLMHKGTSFLKE